MWHWFQSVALTDTPLSPIPGDPDSPLGPVFPCRATVLPMSAGSTGHTSHGSPWRFKNTQHVDETAHRHRDKEFEGGCLRGYCTFSPLYPPGPLGPYDNSRIPVKHWCSGTQSDHCLLEAPAYITEYQSMCKRSLSPDLPTLHLVLKLLCCPVNTNHCVSHKNIVKVTLKNIPIKASLFYFIFVSLGLGGLRTVRTSESTEEHTNPRLK